MTTLKELKASAAERGETLHTTVALWESGKEKTQIKSFFFVLVLFWTFLPLF